MNEERLLKIVEDMSESIKNLQDCKEVLRCSPENKTTIFIEFGLKQIFVGFFITVESLTSIILKELKEFKIGIDMKDSLSILKNNGVINSEIHVFLNVARLLRNRISHRYKEPSREELLEFIENNNDNFFKVLELAKGYIK
ncbi:hypothetical protein CPJCM30710_14740 [Clostridium polyendosporum]|uniref:DUF86 domain-containing protein n=1 Tax=Clostridium polyendosporum TaxID=69208 RepID=A0A919S1C5_9CLOT|nr:HepT-like ribonuclease domain-containing protein [Clostridium polyendosporum]GIM28808.1 hypothetical protein CPJCM30710_14740 [Clostridium polyendosporum]